MVWCAGESAADSVRCSCRNQTLDATLDGVSHGRAPLLSDKRSCPIRAERRARCELAAEGALPTRATDQAAVRSPVGQPGAERRAHDRAPRSCPARDEPPWRRAHRTPAGREPRGRQRPVDRMHWQRRRAARRQQRSCGHGWGPCHPWQLAFISFTNTTRCARCWASWARVSRKRNCRSGWSR